MGKVDYWTKMYNNHYLDLQDGDELVTSSSETSSSYHNAYLFQNKAESFISSHSTKYGTSTPFFLYYSMQLIHSPVSAPDIYVSRCHSSTVDDDYKADTERNYCGLNVMLDEAIANLTCSLNNYGYNENTYLIIASDNGGGWWVVVVSCLCFYLILCYEYALSDLILPFAFVHLFISWLADW